MKSSLIKEVKALILSSRLYSGSPLELGVDVAASIRKNVGANLKRLLKKNNLTQRKLAEELGTDEEVVSRWANGHAMPEAKQFDKMREKYGWKYDEMVRDPSVTDPVEELLRTLDDAGLEIVKRKPLN